MRDSCGIKAIIFDKDNTLTAPYDISIHEKAAFGLTNAIDVFGHDNVAILSNSAGTKDDIDYKDANTIEEQLGINVIRHSEKKPGGLKEVLDHFKDHGVVDAHELCMVGDRLLTDVVFGNLHGMLTVHCLPLCSGEENIKDNKVASALRKVENKVLYKDWWIGNALRRNTIQHKIWKGDEKCPLILLNDKQIYTNEI